MVENHNEKEFISALKVNDGIEQPPVIHPQIAEKLKKKHRNILSINEYVDGITAGNRMLLGKAITLTESTLPEHQDLSQQIIEACLPYSGKSLLIGITGVPGVGKSTFIEALGKHLTSLNKKIAVLAIDPSSQLTKGSILGDKTRMEELAVDPNAFIRPSPSACTLGGVARKTRETIILCEAAGFNTIFVETVGVGQSETTVRSMVDLFLLLMLAGAGDELQGIKRGIMEMADILIINKADGDNIRKAEAAKMEYQNALHLFPPAATGWIPKVTTCSATAKTGILELWHLIEEYQTHIIANGWYHQNRNEQAKCLMYEAIDEALKNNFYQNTIIDSQLKDLEKKVLTQQITSYVAAQKIMKQYFEHVRNR